MVQNHDRVNTYKNVVTAAVEKMDSAADRRMDIAAEVQLAGIDRKTRAEVHPARGIQQGSEERPVEARSDSVDNHPVPERTAEVQERRNRAAS